MSDRQKRRQRRLDHRAAGEIARTHPELVELLREQLAFLEASAAAYDRGVEAESKRLAVTIRLLVHETNASKSLLGQLRILPDLRFVDDAQPIDPRNMVSTPGLFMTELNVRAESGAEAAGARYIPYMGAGPHSSVLKRTPFDRWWNGAVSKLADGTQVSRRQYVLTIADKEGGAHLDPASDPVYVALARDNALGFTFRLGLGDERPVGGDPVLAAVRQVAYEVSLTIAPELRRMKAVSEDRP